MISLALSLLLSLPARAQVLLHDNFTRGGIIAAGAPSTIWEAEAGELSGKRGTGWSNSPVLRLFTRRSDFKNVAVSFNLLTRGLDAGSAVAERPWDGVHLWLRYRSEDSHYYASVNRRDGTVVIKKKAAGPEGATYYALTPYAPYPVPFDSWQSLRATIHDRVDGSVEIALYAGDALLLSATDDGSQGGSPIVDPGRVGLRGDNAELYLGNFEIAMFDPLSRSFMMANASATVSGARAVVSWKTAGDSDSTVEYGLTSAYGSTALGGWGRDHSVALQGLMPGCEYHYRVRSRSGSGIVEGADQTFSILPVDGFAPTVSLVAPAQGQALIGVVTVAAAADANGVVGMQFLLDGVSLGAECLTAPYAQAFNSALFSDGVHALTVIARNAAGNRGSASMTVLIANNNAQSGGSSAPQAAPIVPDASPRPAAAALSAAVAAADPARAVERFLSPALADGVGDLAHFGAQAVEIRIFNIRGREVYHALRQGGGALTWNGRDLAGRLVESGVYIAKILKQDGGSVFQSLAIAK